MNRKHLILVIIAVLLIIVLAGISFLLSGKTVNFTQLENLLKQAEVTSPRDFSPEGLEESEPLGQTGDPEADRELDAIETELKTTDSKAFEADF